MKVNIPHAKTIAMCRVVRQESPVLSVPQLLLVEGDVVELAVGEMAPVRLRSLGPKPTILERGQIHAPQSLEVDGGLHKYTRYCVLETPFQHYLCDMLKLARPMPVVEQHYKESIQLVCMRIIPSVALVSILIGVLRFIVPSQAVQTAQRGFELIALNPALTVLPLLPLGYPLLREIMIEYANARVITLFDELQSSKREFEEEEEDEFDEDAPPPVKDVKIESRAVWRKFWNNLFTVDARNLSRSTCIFESIADISVLSVVDRDGTVASTYPSADQFIFNDHVDGLIAVNVAQDEEKETGVRFEDVDWEQRVASLRPMCLNLLLNANCAMQDGKRRTDHHRRFTPILEWGAHHARQTCLCRYAIEAGIPSDASGAFQHVGQFHVLRDDMALLLQKANPNRELASATCNTWQDAHGGYQLLTEGNGDLVLALCRKAWHGTQLEFMDDVLLERWRDVLENSSLNDIYCMALAYKPVEASFLDTMQGKDIFLETHHPFDYNDYHNQIFLGVVTFASTPKPVRCVVCCSYGM
jgi:hypothetical protein